MADGISTNFSFVLPEVGGSENTWGDKLVANWQSIDTLLFGRALKTTSLVAGDGLTGGGDLSQDRSFALAGQALALHQHATNGILVRTGASSYASRTVVAGSSAISVANGDGATGNISIDIGPGMVTTGGTHTLTGVVTFSQAATFLAGAEFNGPINIKYGTARIELGSVSAASTPSIDFHSSGFDHDRDARIYASGGGATEGQGELFFTGAGFTFAGSVTSTAGGFNGNGSGLTTLNASNIASGTLADARLSSNIGRLDTTQTFSAAKTFSAGATGTTFQATTGFLAPAGDNAAAPGYSWASDTDTGVYRIAADQIGIAAGGALRLTINSSGISGAGSGLTSLNASNVSSGTLGDARLSSNVPLKDAAQAFSGQQTFSAGAAGAFFQVSAANGFQAFLNDSVLAPSFTWVGDLQTGMYRTSGGEIGFTVAGTQRAVISASGIGGVGTNLTALNASQLTSGTLPNARLAGTYTSPSIQTDGTTNTLRSTPSSGSPSVNDRTVLNLVEYKSDTVAPVGAIVFVSPSGLPAGSGTYIRMHLTGHLHSTTQTINTIIGFQRTSTVFNQTYRINLGNLDVQVRLAHNPSGQMCVILGDVGTTWSYPHVQIAHAMFGHNGASDTWVSGWTATMVTDLTGYTELTTPTTREIVTAITADSITTGSFAIGRLPVASQAQAEAGTDTTTVMTPQRVAQAITKRAVVTVAADVTASRNLTDADLAGGVILRVNSASAVTLTVPAGLTNNQPVTVIRGGTGTVSFAASGTTIQSESSFLSIAAQHTSAVLLPLPTSNTYVLMGSLS